MRNVNTEPTFSIIVCNFNYADFVSDAIFSALNQDYPISHFEVITVDDGSSDHSRSIIDSFKHHANFSAIFHKKNDGQYAAFKSGIESAKHNWICLLDSDDIFFRDKLKTLALFINKKIDVDLFLCHDLKMWNQETGYSEQWFNKHLIQNDSSTINDFVSTYPFTVPCGLIFHSSIIGLLLDQISPNEWKRGADNPLVWGAFLINQKISYLHQTLAIYRIHQDNFFMGSEGNGFSPKINPFDRWPKLLNFIENLNDSNVANSQFIHNKNKLIAALKKFSEL
ncbi:glycosyltransferase family A protein [Polynucleobacter sp. JS-JIR-II-b4]|uniref:glycosyltransferase family 2 protein n=1 Tax=Polynucleobacter sp. JS-JIR-II-b4 TaxID=1758390 RepID=UPI001BFDFEEB|nr:glycosyltransferase family A protein [Polynucleobacter sp. JS-JIR-II-b4]QWE02878.1 glycosyltransferase family 2 protein [Polynucleobacter sp. JS-JIR-II-b4]